MEDGRSFLQSSFTNSIISPGADWPGTESDQRRHRITPNMAGLGTHLRQKWPEAVFIHAKGGRNWHTFTQACPHFPQKLMLVSLITAFRRRVISETTRQ